MARDDTQKNRFVRAQLIDGELVEGEGVAFTVENPGTEEVVAEPVGASLAQVEAAILSARRAFDNGGWSDISVSDRAVVLRRFVGMLRDRSPEIADLIIREAGCPISSWLTQVQYPIPLQHADEIIDYVSKLPEIEENPLPLRERVNPYGQVVQSIKRYTPIGVVAAIAAYNYPFFTAIWKIIPALATGNTVVLRPSPFTPLTAVIIAEAAIAAGLPRGVLNVVIEGGHEGGQLLTTHKAVDMVAFTGSTAVGELVMVQAARTMKRLQLELGGKSAQIFMPDSMEAAAASAIAACTAHAGQGCALGTRLFVPESEKASVMRAMAATLEQVVIGNPADPATTLGPVISAAQRARCEHYVALATEQGAKVVYGGRRPAGIDRGYFFEPTVLDVPDNANPAAQEEIFGPVVSVIGYRDIDHAIEMANDSPYGLSGYVFGKNKTAALDIALRLKTGTVNVNGGLLSSFASSGGQRMSGFGRERGLEGIRLYQQLTGLNLAG